MNELHLSCPAKLNLFLRVLGKKPDGFHEVVTVLQRISLADRLRLKRISKGIQIETDHPDVPRGHGNILGKAFRILKEKVSFEGGVQIFLAKRIPIAAGLGGGSSDAASFLKGLNRLFRLGLGKDHLMAIGREIGADVPFFLAETPLAIGRGIGDQIEPVSGVRKYRFLVTVMPFGLLTRQVYQGLGSDHRAAALTKVSCDASMLCEFLRARDDAWISRLLANDLLPVAWRIKPALKRVFLSLKREAPASMMTGSGPTFFSVVESKKEGRLLEKKIGLRWNYRTFLCEGV